MKRGVRRGDWVTGMYEVRFRLGQCFLASMMGFFAATRSEIQGHESHAEGRGFAGNISRQRSMRSWLLGPGDGPKIG